MIQNPPLDEDLLIHFGVKGMRWGQRNPRADEGERKATFGKSDNNSSSSRGNAGSNSGGGMSGKKKVAIGLAVVGGAIAVGLILKKTGATKLTDGAVTQWAQGRSAKQQAAANPVKKLAQKFRDTKAASVPSPNQMIADARMAGVRNSVNAQGAQRLTEKAWRDQANISRLTRSMDSTTNSLLSGNSNFPSLEETRRRLADPNFVWNL